MMVNHIVPIFGDSADRSKNGYDMDQIIKVIAIPVT